MVLAVLIVPAKLMVRAAGTRHLWGSVYSMAVLPRVERHALFIAIKNFTACGVLMWFYLGGDVDDNLLLVSMLVGMITIDVVRQGMIPAVSRKVSCAFSPFISLYLLS
jgi:hypothetical protein